MELKFFKRTAKKKSEVNEIRRKGDIPATLCSKGKESESIYVNGPDFHAILRSLEEGRLATTVFTLVSGEEKSKVLVKDIQYHPATYDVAHLDFVKITDEPVSVNVPVVCLNMNDCAGVKLGGVLRRVARHVRVKCLPKDIPSHFEVDLKEMQMNDVKKIKDLNISAKATLVDFKMEDAIVVVAKPAKTA